MTKVIKITLRKRGTFVLRTVEPICKELEIETEHRMEILFQRLLFSDTIDALKPFIVTYLNQPQDNRGISQNATRLVHLDLGYPHRQSRF